MDPTRVAGGIFLALLFFVLANFVDLDSIFGPTTNAPASGAQAGAPDQRRARVAGTEPASCAHYSGTARTQAGDRGDRVRTVQCRLRVWGYNIGPDGIDGVFGNDTRAAVLAFQRDTARQCGAPGLTADGVVGPRTWSALRSPTGCP